MYTDRHSLHDWQALIRAEYEELPDLQLTQSQVEVLWTLDSVTAGTDPARPREHRFSEADAPRQVRPHERWLNTSGVH
jgi:hypothetical protein